MEKIAQLGPSVAPLLLLLTASPLAAAEETHTRGFYVALEGSVDTLSAQAPCPRAYKYCAYPVHLYARAWMYGVGVGYTVNTHLAVEAIGHGTPDYDLAVTNSETDGPPAHNNVGVTFRHGDVGVAIRAGWPITHNWKAFVRATGEYEELTGEYNPHYAAARSLSVRGAALVISGGLSYTIPDIGYNVRLSIDRRTTVNTLAAHGFTLGFDFGYTP